MPRGYQTCGASSRHGQAVGDRTARRTWGRILAAMGVLAGSLGGRSDSRDLVRGVLFILEDT